jgi:hypothetical protein
MPHYMASLMRSGTMWSCGEPARLKPRAGFLSSLFSWIRAERPSRSVSLLFRGDAIKRGMRRY